MSASEHQSLFEDPVASLSLPSSPTDPPLFPENSDYLSPSGFAENLPLEGSNRSVNLNVEKETDKLTEVEEKFTEWFLQDGSSGDRLPTDDLQTTDSNIEDRLEDSLIGSEDGVEGNEGDTLIGSSVTGSSEEPSDTLTSHSGHRESESGEDTLSSSVTGSSEEPSDTLTSHSGHRESESGEDTLSSRVTGSSEEPSDTLASDRGDKGSESGEDTLSSRVTGSSEEPSDTLASDRGDSEEATAASEDPIESERAEPEERGEIEVISVSSVEATLAEIYNSGVFEVISATGEVGIDFLYDGGGYRGELALFSLTGMNRYKPGSPEFIKEAARRALSNSTQGYVAIADRSEGARFTGELGERNQNSGDYKGIKRFVMEPGDTFGVMLVPHGTVQEVYDDPTVGGAKRPLFSMTTANPNESFHVGQIADVTGDGHTFVMEDLRTDRGTDRDYNDVIFQVRGATAETVHLDSVIPEGKDWRTSELGEALVNYTKTVVDLVNGYVETTSPEYSDPVQSALERSQDLENYDAEALARTTDWVIWLDPNLNPDQIATLFDAENLGETGQIDDTYIFQFSEEKTPEQIQTQLQDLVGSDYPYPLIPIQLIPPQHLPEYPMADDQWHLRDIGEIDGIASEGAKVLGAWELATGEGVTIAIVDDGILDSHPNLESQLLDHLQRNFNETVPESELIATPPVELEESWWWWWWWRPPFFNRRPGLSWMLDPEQEPEMAQPQQHGTSTAGVVAGDGTNGISGVAPEASVVDFQLTAADVTDEQIGDALFSQGENGVFYNEEIDIYNNSWKPAQSKVSTPLSLAALEKGVAEGREGKGNVYVYAAGNDRWLGENVNYNPFANSRHTIAVGAIGPDGKQSWYSESGASLFISAPSSSTSEDGISVGIPTSDLSGEAGYNSGGDSDENEDYADGNYTKKFGGTSAAAPIVSATAALMLEVNSDLSYRDVQHILVETAQKTDAENPDWVQNKAGYWVNPNYGFGAISAEDAVEAAANWTPVAPEVSVKSTWQTVNAAIPDYEPDRLLGEEVANLLQREPETLSETEREMLRSRDRIENDRYVESAIAIEEDIQVEWVEVVFDASHTYRGDLKVELISPDGTVSQLSDRHGDPNDNYDNWVFTSAQHWGESSQGEWKLRVSDEWGNEVGNWNGWKLNFFGTETPTTVNVTATDGDATEDGNAGQFVVTREGGNLARSLTVEYQMNGTASNGNDYQELPETITFAPGQTSVTIGVNPIHDYELEGNETVEISLRDLPGYRVGENTDAIVTIANSTTTDRYGSFVYVNPDNGHLYLLSEPDTWLGAQNQAEAVGGNLVSINTADEQQWIVDTFGTSQVFHIGLTDSEMYGNQEGDFKWVNGDPITYENWKQGEPNNFSFLPEGEDFSVINQHVDGKWNDRTYIGNFPGIIEIDPAQLEQPIVNIMVTDSLAGEDGNAGQIVFQRIGNLDQSLSVNYTWGGDATNGSDLQTLSDNIIIPAGETLVTLPIIALPDDEIEGDETLVVNLAEGDYENGTHSSGHIILTDQNPINRIANEVIGRDVSLFEHWMERWQNGETLEQLRPEIVQAAVDGQGNNEAQQKIAEFYQELLGREAETTEIAYWQNQLETGATLSQVRQEIEGADLIDTTSYVYTNPVTGNRYFLTTPDTWLGAQEQAEALGGNLVTIDDADENQWLFDTFGGGGMWIGLNDSPIYGNTEGNHQWLKGNSTYTNWSLTEPNNVLHTPEGEDFSETNFGTPGLWNDMPSQQNFLRQGIVEISYAPSYNWTWTQLGEDLHTGDNSVRLASLPNTETARNEFVANLINVETVDFENFAHNDTPNTLDFGNTTATLSGDLKVQTLPAGTDGGMFPTSGDNYLLSSNDESFTIDFNSPQSAFGFTVTDAEGDPFVLTLHREDGTTSELTIPVTASWPANSGSALFFGVTDPDTPFTGVTVRKPEDTERIGVDDLIIGQVNPNLPATPTPPNQTLNLTYTEDTPLNLSDIVVSDPDGETSVTLTLFNPAAGVLSNGGGIGQYNATTGVWTANGAVADVNAALADLQFVPTANFNQDVSIALAITDDIAAPLTGAMNLKGIPVNNPPTVTTSNLTLTGATENAGFTVTHADLVAATGASDADGDPLTFRIQNVGSDIPTKNGQPVEAGVTTLSAGEAIVWTPTTVGNGQSAFTATLTDGTVTVATPVTVSVDVNPVTVSIEATDPDATEGSDPGEFTFTRTGDTTNPMTVNFTIEPSIHWGRPQAKNGTDYATIPTSITIPEGETSITLTITSLEDTETEWPETVRLQLDEGEGYEINSSEHLDTVVIWDNEIPKLRLYAEWYTGQPTNFHQESYTSESGNNERFLLRRIGSLEEDLTVYYSLPGTATNGEDYEELPGSITIPAGRRDVYFTFIPIDDSEVEGDETVELTLTPDPTYTFMNHQGRIWDRIPVTLVDNDDKPTVEITVSDNQASEYGDPGQFTISRTGDTSNPLTVDYWISTAWWHKAKNGIDYEAIPESITIPAGESSITIDINPIDDNELEEDEIVDIYLKSNPNYAMRGTYYAKLRILDNETQYLESQQQFGTSAEDVANSVAVDSAGNTYTVGHTSGDLDGTNAGGSDGFIVKRDSSGNELWEIQLGTAGDDEAKQIAVDSADNLYVLGWSGDPSNSWIAKYDSNGTQLWQNPLGSAGYDITNSALTLGNDGSLYVTGRTTGDIDGTNQGATDTWVAKYDSDGIQTWVKQLGTTDEDEALGITVDNNDNVYITGETKGSLAGTREGDGDAWVAQLDSSGNLQWQTQLGTTAVDIARSVAVDNNGHVYLGGQTFGWLGETYPGDPDDWVGDRDAWWAGIHGDKSGLGGTYYGNGDAWVAQLDSTTGSINWKRLLGTTNADSGTTVVADSLGNVYLTGTTEGQLGDAQFGADDIFLAKYNVDGALQWKQQFGSDSDDVVNDMILDITGIYLAGDTTGDLEGSNLGEEDAWMMKLS